MTDENKLFEQLVQKHNPQNKLLRAWALAGGISAQVTALEIARADGQTQKLVVRRHGAADLAKNPQIAADEFTLLQRLHAAGLPVPAPYAVTQSGEIFATPCIVIAYIEGATEFSPANLPDMLRQFATHLAQIHAVDWAALGLSFLPDYQAGWNQKVSERPVRLDDSLAEGRIRDTLAALWPLQQHNKTTLLHGDFWPGNLLWQDGQLVGIIDWEDAALGDPLVDLANSRLEILFAFGDDAMQQFTAEYQALTQHDVTNLPYWDLAAALRPAFKLSEWAADAQAESAMRAAHQWFVTQAFEKLSTKQAQEESYDA